MAKRDIVVVGASAGGVGALQTFVAALPADLDAAVLIVLHIAPTMKSELEWILQRHARLPVVVPRDGQLLDKGRVYIASPDHHLLLQDRTLRVVRGPKENRARPSIDALFRSAAYSAGSRTIGVILTGMLDDGTAGLWAIKERGGIAIVQDPEDAEFPSMPESALQYVDADYVLKLTEIAPRVAELAAHSAPAPSAVPASAALVVETAVARGEMQGRNADVLELGAPTPFTCPECHGALIRLKEEGVPRFRCHTGHAFSIGSLLAGLTEEIQGAFAHFARGVDESALLLDHLAAHLRDAGDAAGAVRLDDRATDTRRRAAQLRDVMRTHEVLAPEYSRRRDGPFSVSGAPTPLKAKTR